jgi:hypothetical protein
MVGLVAGPVFTAGRVVGGGAAGRDGFTGGLGDTGCEVAGRMAGPASAVCRSAAAGSGRPEWVIDKRGRTNQSKASRAKASGA